MYELDPAFQPRLRDGLRFENGGDPSIVRVVDRDGHQHEMYEIECLIAREMDGTRSVSELARIARRFLGTIKADQIAKLVRQLAGMGLLSNLDPPMRVSPAPPSVLPYVDDLKSGLQPSEVTLRFRAVSHDPFLEPREDDEFGPEDTSVDLSAEPDPKVVPSDDEWEVVEPPPDDDDDDEEVAPPPPPTDVPALHVERQTTGGLEWKPETLPWYAKPAARRLRIPIGAALIAALLAIIEYPLYVTEECVVISGQRSHVRTQVDGLLHEINFDEGDTVKAGDVIARLDPRATDAALEQAKAEVGRLTANLQKQLRGARPEELATARAALAAALRDARFAKREAQRKAALFKQGVTSAEQRDMAMRDMELKRSAAAQAEAELKLLQAGSRKEEVAMAEAELRRAEIEVRHLEQRRTLLTITAPVSGQITTPRFKERLHEHVSTGEIICEIADAEVMDVEVYVPEREIDSIAIGLPVVVKVASYPLHPLEGQVTFIAPTVAEVEGERVVRVLTRVENPDAILREGMSGYGEINAGEHSLLWLGVRRVIRWVRVRFLI